MKYSDFKNDASYAKTLSREQVEFLFYQENADGTTSQLPIARGESMSWNASIEQFEVSEWGKDVIDEWADGKYRISGTVGLFFTPKGFDALPNSQNFAGKYFRVIKRISSVHPTAAGTVLGMVENVKLNSKDFTANGGVVRTGIRFVASREYSGDECEALGIVGG